MAYRELMRRTLFRLGGGDAETAHERTLAALARLGSVPPAVRLGSRLFGVPDPVTVCGIRFPNRVGLAAGMDKDGRALRAWPALGFGFVEVGTVTAQPQPGNPRPRLYRLPDSAAIVNRMGFNNDGAARLAERLDASRPLGYPLGISIGKSRSVPAGDAVGDYLRSLDALYPYGDYFAVNVSSPNTPGLRGLQDAAAARELLGALRERIEQLRGDAPPAPLLVKISPDLPEDALVELLDVLAEHRISGVIATNTTLDRGGVVAGEAALAEQPGGLSGAPLAARSLEVVRRVAKHTGGRLPIVGVGGIGSAEQAARMLDAGASLVQLYTGLVYGGPLLVRAAARAARARRAQASCSADSSRSP